MLPEYSVDIDVDIDWPVAEQRVLRYLFIWDFVGNFHIKPSHNLFFFFSEYLFTNFSFILRYGYFGRVMPEVVRLMFCRVSGCLTESRIFVSASGEEMVSINTRDTMGICLLQQEEVEVTNLTCHLASLKASSRLLLLDPRQVVLLTSREDPVGQSLADKLAKRFSCQLVQVGEEPMDDLYPMVEKRNLQWKDVAYMGKPVKHLGPHLCLKLIIDL